MAKTSPKKGYFLPYQEEWLKDTSRLKIAEKSRRIGFTYVQAYEDTVDAARANGIDVWFTSADISAAREYIRYVEQWAKLLHLAATHLGEVVLDAEDDVKALVVEFANGKRIHALSSNPKGFRSKGGKVVIDEYAFHDQADDLWKAAAPAVLWGYPIRVFSSHNGKNTRFYRMVEEAKQQGSKWSHHRITIEDAIHDGLVEKIKGLNRPATETEIAEFLEECKNIAGDTETYDQEFMCNPQDDKSNWIPYSLIYACETPELNLPMVLQGSEINPIAIEDFVPQTYYSKAPENKNPFYLGVDIGRKRDLTVLSVFEQVGDVAWLRVQLELSGMQFRHQYKVLASLVPLVSRCCIDSTGIGAQLAEDARLDFGSKCEEVVFSNAVKAELAVTTKRYFEDRKIRLPQSEVLRKDIAKIKKTVTIAGNVRFEGERDADGHADRFWSVALALHAMSQPKAPYGSATAGSGRYLRGLT